MWVCGVDEVGRGPLAGAVVTAAVILDPDNPIEGLADSKKLSLENSDAINNAINRSSISCQGVIHGSGN